MNSVHKEVCDLLEPKIFNDAYKQVNNDNIWHKVFGQIQESIAEQIFLHKLYQVHYQLRETVND